MNDPLPFVMLLALACMAAPAVLVPVGLLLLAVRRVSERTASLRELASQLGLSFTPGRCALPPELRGSPLFTEGRSRKAYNVMRGEIGGRSALAFDYSFLRSAAMGIGSGNRSWSAPHQVAAFRIDDGPPPDLESLRLDPRASVCLTSAVNGWLVVARPGLMPPQLLGTFINNDAVRVLGIALREAVPASSPVNRRIP